MPRIENGVLVRETPVKVFALTNDVSRWPELFADYTEARVLSEEPAGRFTKVVFELRNEAGQAWRSWRLLDHQELTAIAEREDPLYPFRYMHLKWTYRAVPEGTSMVWTQDFEVDERVDISLEEVVRRMNAHTVENQQRIKETIESLRARERELSREGT
ncbi:SRPBCC family protein [Streptomyces sp. NPDC019443]|uniref:SRPBCC family protein n=1 Tax=Streptomyces sp. NPDC019443 TaxID=3365061 RepID=UPI003793C4EF